MAVRRNKPVQHSRVFEQVNMERLKRATKTINSAKQTIEKSKQLTQEADELIKKLQKRKTG